MAMSFKNAHRLLTYPMVVLLIKLLRGIAMIVPPTWIQGFVQVIARCGWFFLARLRKVSLANLRIAFPTHPEEELKHIGFEAFKSMVSLLFEFLIIPLSKESMLEKCQLSPSLKKILDRYNKSPAIGVSMHLGNWEYGNLYCNAAGYSLCCVVREHKSNKLDQLINERRLLTGGDIIFAEGSAAGMVRTLRKEGKILITLIDQNIPPRRGGLFVRFFGLPVTVSRAPAALARRLNIPLFIIACVRNRDGYELIGEMVTENASEFNSDEELTAQIIRQMEAIIRKYPEQYLWMYRRFRYIPGDWLNRRERFPFYARPLNSSTASRSRGQNITPEHAAKDNSGTASR